MAARSTRKKIVDSKERVFGHLGSINSELMYMWNLAENRSEIINQSFPITIRNIELLKELLESLFKGM